MRWVFALVIAAGCYGPSPVPGAPCAPGNVCPRGLECRNDLCVVPGTPSDGPRPDGPPGDGPVDGPRPDAPPNLSGCSDGEREGFPNLTDFPTIAACDASWDGTKNMRAAKSGSSCGDDLGMQCEQPADACADGWSICGSDGSPKSISERADANACLTVGGVDAGAYAAGLSHCTNPLVFCEYVDPYPCFDAGDCSEAVCCGPLCSSALGCQDGIYPGATRATSSNAIGCGALDIGVLTGVLCCQD